MTDPIIGIRVRAWDSQSIRVLAGFRQTLAARRLPWRWQVSTKRKKRASLSDIPAQAWVLGPGVRPPHDRRPALPIVLADEFAALDEDGCHMAATLDQGAVGLIAAAHLRECGYPSFAVIMPDQHGALRERSQAFAAAIAGAGMPCRSAGFPADPAGQAVSLRRLVASLDQQPFGIFCPDDHIAAQLRDLCRAAGRQLPDSCGILGSGDLSSACLATTPELSSVSIPWLALGSAAVGQLQRLFEDRDQRGPSLIRPYTVEARASTRFSGHGDVLVRRACAWMRKNLHRPWSMAELAQHLEVSEATLNRRMRIATGSSPHAWRNRRRTEEAQRLLADPLLSIAQVQRRCGFGSLRHFHRQLQLHCGMGPAAYRRHLLPG
ncbi:MAG: helix-turn-helix domain-containing protein [Planctomycetota bacterium]|nr:MAG: helix-turn-helix domain-containing protein [Planctomycetota bacterium]